MATRAVDNRATLSLEQRLIPLRGPSGRLWGMYDPHTQTLEFRHGQQIDRIQLSQYQQTPTPTKKGNG